MAKKDNRHLIGTPLPHYQTWYTCDGEPNVTHQVGWKCPFCGDAGVKQYCPNCGAEINWAEETLRCSV